MPIPPTVQEQFAARTITADEAARLVRPGHNLFIGTACATPVRILAALQACMKDYAIPHGLRGFVAEVPASNEKMTRSLRRASARSSGEQRHLTSTPSRTYKDEVDGMKIREQRRIPALPPNVQI